MKRVKIVDQNWEFQKSVSMSYKKIHFYIYIYYMCKNNVILTFENFIKNNEKS